MIKLYTKPNCPGCRMSKMFLDRNNVEYTTIDVTEEPSAIEYIKSLGYAALPVVETPTKHWTGYNPDLLGQLA